LQQTAQEMVQHGNASSQRAREFGALVRQQARSAWDLARS